ncbi:MAG TPA: helix-turn-helix domain-containing protein [Bosea sp. (in: a-proteobacteria)]|uniref:helix-turn-helix domain-containing protein n=1 Tax=Bosea sp. (in: a-proteobacteria) TaxID=1871050 RepID=UPI002DDD6C06|nr:helix-turn-helix domain-containing protein [Bosea sp. (in: a-proteobacteria)]HEV2555259.1 helix-turn-helix domain-containing protein [Bosea sp. (in: a-proteobacteria)]
MSPTETLAYAPKQAAQVIGIGLTALYAEIKDGKIKPRKFGRRTLIEATELRQWLDALPSSKREAA